MRGAVVEINKNVKTTLRAQNLKMITNVYPGIMNSIDDNTDVRWNDSRAAPHDQGDGGWNWRFCSTMAATAATPDRKHHFLPDVIHSAS